MFERVFVTRTGAQGWRRGSGSQVPALGNLWNCVLEDAGVAKMRVHLPSSSSADLSRKRYALSA